MHGGLRFANPPYVAPYFHVFPYIFLFYLAAITPHAKRAPELPVGCVTMSSGAA